MDVYGLINIGKGCGNANICCTIIDLNIAGKGVTAWTGMYCDLRIRRDNIVFMVVTAP